MSEQEAVNSIIEIYKETLGEVETLATVIAMTATILLRVEKNLKDLEVRVNYLEEREKN